MATDNASRSTLQADTTRSFEVVRGSEYRSQCTIYNDRSLGADIALIGLGEQACTILNYTMELFPGATYELPNVQAPGEEPHVFNGPVQVLWRTNSGGRLLITDVRGGR